VFRGAKKKETEKRDRNNEQVQSAVAKHSEGEASKSVREAPPQIGSTFSQDLSEARSPLFVRQEEAETREEMAQGVYLSESPPPGLSPQRCFPLSYSELGQRDLVAEATFRR
jgi:hypothetical protein